MDRFLWMEILTWICTFFFLAGGILSCAGMVWGSNRLSAYTNETGKETPPFSRVIKSPSLWMYFGGLLLMGVAALYLFI